MNFTSQKIAVGLIGVAVIAASCTQKPQDASTHYNRGLAAFNNGRFDDAIQDYSRAIKLNSKFSEAYNNRGYTYETKGDLERAISDYTTAVQCDPANGRAFNNRAKAYEKKNELDKTIADYTAVIRLCTNDAGSYFARGCVYVKKGDWDKAFVDFDQTAQLCPTNAATFQNRGYAQLQRKKFEQAITDFKTALQFDPQNAEILNNLAWALSTCPTASVRNGKDAVEAAKKACELTGWKSWLQVGTLAAGFAETGNFDEAIKYQKQALKIDGVRDIDRPILEERLRLYERHEPFHERLSP